MSWDEWEQLKADAAARGSARMQLNHVPMDPGGSGTGDLKSDKKVWTKAGEDTKGLQDDVDKALGKLGDGQSGLGELSGVQSAAAQKELYASWKKYVEDVKGRCGELGGLMERSGRDLTMSDAEVKAELDKIQSKYQDTAAVGGQAKGR
ncbi:hypothetical protein [Streptomyces cyanogenus]|uniref:Uncharacterized protein n=1 Tax=Streptomyces cyanogenus TaxID=80860 RepID=A0ABX7TUU6_STRCY|nr:hypothetical protein [Streptomyces cyanogenus]QTE00493.1 hypothetical protein S1361_24395 [Streptomyces cyanogenus]